MATPQAVGIQPVDMDLSVDPGEDFNHFANGGWEARAELSADSPTYGAADEVFDRVIAQMFAVVEGLDTDPSTSEGKARAIYDQYLDTETRDAQGVTPLEPTWSSSSARS